MPGRKGCSWGCTFVQSRSARPGVPTKPQVRTLTNLAEQPHEQLESVLAPKGPRHLPLLWSCRSGAIAFQDAAAKRERTKGEGRRPEFSTQSIHVMTHCQ